MNFKPQNYYLFILLLIVMLSGCKSDIKQEEDIVAEKKLISYVNPFIGTEDNTTEIHSVGNTHPGAVRPWGMVAVSPQSFDFTKMQLATGYRHEQDKIFGFSCVNFSGVGCPGAGNIPFKFFTKPFEGDYNGSSFSEQVASPGFYSVKLDDENIHISATTTTRSAILKVDLPKGESNVYLDLMAQQGHVKGGKVETFTNKTASGYQLEGYFCGAANRSTVYFNLELHKEADSTYLKYNNKSTNVFKQGLDDDPSGIVYVFNNDKPSTVFIKVGVSYVSVENALNNVKSEQTGFEFDKIKTAAEFEWETELSKIKVETSDKEDKTVFYTALYHSLLMPMTNSDYNGEYIKMGSEEVGKSDHTRYTAFSLWDTYRTVHPLVVLAYPERQQDMVKTMLDIYDESGWLPKWPIFNYEPHLMVGDPAPIVIGDSYMKGVRGFDIDKAYEAFTKHANQIKGNLNRRGIEDYNTLGYISMDGKFSDTDNFSWSNGIVWGPVSTNMEINLSDFNIAQVAKALGKEDDYKKYLNQSMSFMHFYDEDLGLFRPKNVDGSWLKPFDPTQKRYDKMNYTLRGGPGFVEGSSWQYMFSIPHGIDTLKAKMGDEKFKTQLNTIFDDKHFDMTNEPGLGFPFFYNYTDERDYKTSKTVHGLLKEHFTNAPNGVPGNDDAGTMSAWVVFAMIGIYPDTPGNPEYLVTTPVMDKITIALNSDFYKGRELVIERKGPVDGRIKEMTLNGKPIDYKVNHLEMTSKTSHLIVVTE